MNGAELGAVKLLVTIVDRGRGERAAELCQGMCLPFNYICLGQGTANSQILDYLGLGETRKDVVCSLIPAERAAALTAAISERMQLERPGHGIVFLLPLSGISRTVSDRLRREIEGEGEEKRMEETSRYDLIVAVVNRGFTETVMEAAKAAGAGGGTVLHARRAGETEAAGFAIQPEKEIVAILIPRERKLAVMQAVNQAAGLTTEGRGVLFSLPVEEIFGLR